MEVKNHTSRDLGLEEGGGWHYELRCFIQELNEESGIAHSACSTEKAARSEVLLEQAQMQKWEKG